jgi:hypothetical protein
MKVLTILLIAICVSCSSLKPLGEAEYIINIYDETSCIAYVRCSDYWFTSESLKVLRGVYYTRIDQKPITDIKLNSYWKYIIIER